MWRRSRLHCHAAELQGSRNLNSTLCSSSRTFFVSSSASTGSRRVFTRTMTQLASSSIRRLKGSAIAGCVNALKTETAMLKPSIPQILPKMWNHNENVRVVVVKHRPRRLLKLLILGAVVYVGVEMAQGEHQAFGAFAAWESPPWFNKNFCLLWTKVFGCNLDEMADPLEHYKTFQEFFTRKLKPGARPVGDGMVSPVDGYVLFIGEMPGDEKVEQIKGMTYELPVFLGENVQVENPENKLYQCIFYLAPGDYHGIHAPVDLTITEHKHFPGLLLPVSLWAVGRITGLFSLNERVVVKSSWKHGTFYLTPVGATNVGSIGLSFDPKLLTNVRAHAVNLGETGNTFFRRTYPAGEGKQLRKGDDFGVFRLGSTVVMHFEGPKDLQWHIKPQEHVKVGQTIANRV